MISILKFFENSNYKGGSGSENENKVISRTLLKIAVVSRHYSQKHPEKTPKHGELWKCRIVKEISSGQNRGCFIVEPIEKIDDQSIVHLIPGWYDTKVVNGRMVIVPRKQGVNWILPLTHKRMLSEEHKAYCVLVLLDELPMADVPSNIPMPKTEADANEDV